MKRFPLDIYMVVPGMAFDGNTPRKTSLGGSETAGICVARELARLGHFVTMFSQLPEGPQKIEGVMYAPMDSAGEVITKVPHDILIVQRAPEIFMRRTASKQTYLWNHDLAQKAATPKVQAAIWNLDGIFLLSEFHINQHVEVFPFLKEDFCILTRNGINGTDLKPFSKVKKNPKKIMYSARPERGLENLVRPGGIMERLHAIDPQIHLCVAGYDNTTEHMADLYRMLWARCEQLPNVTNLGHLKKDDLYRHFAETSLCVYPTDFEEISCITAMECMASETPFVTTRLAALPETLGEKCAIYLDSPAASMQYFDQFAKTVVETLNDEMALKRLRRECKLRARRFEWSDVAKQWDELFFDRFNGATYNRRKLVDHFIYHDDIRFAYDLAFKEGFSDVTARLGTKYSWAMTQDSEPAETYEAYAKQDLEKFPLGAAADQHVNNFEKGGPIGVRWPGVNRWLLDNAKAEAKVLDYGCGAGHFACAMARMGLKVTAVDIAGAYVKRTADLAQKLGVPDGHLVTESQGSPVKAWGNQTYDVIFLGDVLEHVPAPIPLLEELEKHLAPDGKFLLTTPYGPTRTAAPKRSGYRHEMHINHFEPADLWDLFHKKKGFGTITVFWQFSETTQELLAWYLTSFGKKGQFGKVNPERKALIQAPRDRLSVCIIVKNEEKVLAKCLESVLDIADEIIVADTGSTDRTIEIAASYGARVISGPNPLEKGFEASRNVSISIASHEWVLWIDADEELQNGAGLVKFLRPSAYQGFRIRQHHFQCQPVGAGKIDRPVRVFRNGLGVRFFGMVHEHPEIAVNEGVGQVIELPDVDIAHAGYYTETRRREKFWRNLPLLMRDRDKYPQRFLGRFLYLRDLVQLSQWEIEQRGALGDKGRKYCEEAIQVYRNTFLLMGGHMMADGLAYYTTAVRMLGRGREYTWSVSVGNGTAPEALKKAHFENNEDFQAYLRNDVQAKGWLYDSPYGMR